METTPAVVLDLSVLYLISIVLVCGCVAGFIAKKIHIPDIVIFLLVGILLGPQVSDIINFPSASPVNQFILIFGAAYIIFDGGASVSLKVLNNIWISLVVIATVGVVATMVVVGFAAHWIFGIPLIVAMLLGASLASTDPATLVPIFKQIKVREKLSHLVMSESALNDAMGAIATMVMLSLVMGHGGFSAGSLVDELMEEAAPGLVIGAIAGFVALYLTAHRRFNVLGDYAAVITVIVVAGGYMLSHDLKTSGYMAAFSAGLVMGNRRLFGYTLGHRGERDFESFVSNISLIMRMFIFILLGSQVDFGLLSAYWIGGAVLVAVFILVARPAAVFLCCLPDRRSKWQFKELLFLCWVRETGVIPAALAGMLVGIGAPDAQLIASVTFMAILITILVQAPTTKWWGKKLNLLVE